jgi:hypothetical protein
MFSAATPCAEVQDAPHTPILLLKAQRRVVDIHLALKIILVDLCTAH